MPVVHVLLPCRLSSAPVFTDVRMKGEGPWLAGKCLSEAKPALWRAVQMSAKTVWPSAVIDTPRLQCCPIFLFQ